MRDRESVFRATRYWLEITDRQYDPDIGLVWVSRKHTTKDEAQPASGRYHMIAQDGLLHCLALLALGERTEQALRGIDTALAAQDVDPASPQAGNYRWYREDTAVTDRNACFFVNEILLTIYWHFRDQLGRERRRRVEDSFRLSLRHFASPCIGVSYTNAFLGESVLGAALAEMFGDQDALAIVRANWEEFHRQNASHGIPERLAPCYYGVSLTMLAMALGRLGDARIRRIAREAFDVLFQESAFFEHRHPLPARRTYNAHGESLNFQPLAWVLGLNRMTPEDLRRRGWLTGWHLLMWLALRDSDLALDVPALPAPRILEGRFGADDGYVSYYHPDFTLGCFTRYPQPGFDITSPYEMQAAFSGDGESMGMLGVVAQFADGSWTGLPWRDELRDDGPDWRSLHRTMPVDFTFVSHQHENILIWLADVDRLNARLRAFGATVRIPQFRGQMLGEDGRPLAGEGGVLEHGWIFFVTDHARFGVYPLMRVADDLSRCTFGRTGWYRLAGAPDTVRPFPGPWHAHPAPGEVEPFGAPCERVGLTLMNVEGPEARDICCDNLANGAVIVAAGRETAVDEFVAYCTGLEVHDGWTQDRYTPRAGAGGCPRTVRVRGDDVDLGMSYDYRFNRVLDRTTNGVRWTPPSTLSSMRFVTRNCLAVPPCAGPGRDAEG